MEAKQSIACEQEVKTGSQLYSFDAFKEFFPEFVMVINRRKLLRWALGVTNEDLDAYSRGSDDNASIQDTAEQRMSPLYPR